MCRTKKWLFIMCLCTNNFETPSYYSIVSGRLPWICWPFWERPVFIRLLLAPSPRGMEDQGQEQCQVHLVWGDEGWPEKGGPGALWLPGPSSVRGEGNRALEEYPCQTNVQKMYLVSSQSSMQMCARSARWWTISSLTTWDSGSL